MDFEGELAGNAIVKPFDWEWMLGNQEFHFKILDEEQVPLPPSTEL